MITVPVKIPVAEKLDMRGINRVLVASFIQGEHPAINLKNEIIAVLKRELRKHTALEIIDAAPPELPAQNLDTLLKNASFWRSIADRHEADLVISGIVKFDSFDRSGYVQEDYVSPLTGERRRRTRFAERQGFTLELDLYFFRGETGELIYEDYFSEDSIQEGSSADHLDVFFSLAARLEPEILGIVSPRHRQEERYLFTD
ncbi:MAG: hypothetical protein V3U98_05145 [Acidobacteriota bacterium]